MVAWRALILAASLGSLACSDPAESTARLGKTSEPLVVQQQAKLTQRVGVPADQFARVIALNQGEMFVGAAGEPDQYPGQGAVWAWFLNISSWAERQRLVAPDAAPGDGFGSAVAIDGTTAIVGAATDDESGQVDRGSAYVFSRSGFYWAFTQKLTASDGTAGDLFGSAVAIRGGSIIVGAPGRSAGRGSAYVFVKPASSWLEEQRLDAPTPAAGDAFGAAVGIDGASAIVGAPDYDAAAKTDSGAAWVFVRTGTTWGVQYASTGTAANGHRGTAVAISGDRALVGAPNERSDGKGAVRALARSGTTWTEPQELVAPGGAAGDDFGASVALEGTASAVGAPSLASNAGGTYAFEHTGSAWDAGQKLSFPWTQAGDLQGAGVGVSAGYAAAGLPGRNGEGATFIWHKLSGWNTDYLRSRSSAVSVDKLGKSVALWGQTLVVGAPSETQSLQTVGRGAAFVFTRSGTSWSEQAKLVASGSATDDAAGTAVAIEQDDVAVGTPGDDVAGNSDQGSVRIFHRTGTAWSEVATVTIANGKSADWFGTSVALNAGTLAVGAPYREPSFATPSQGAVGVFVGAGASWQQQAELVASDAKADDYFGTSVAVEGNVLLVGSPKVDGTFLNSGAAYVFTRSGAVWAQSARLDPPVASLERRFGTAVAVVGGRLFVSAPGSAGSGSNIAGTVHVYTGGGAAWTLQQSISSPDAHANDVFGGAFAATNGLLAATGQGPATPWAYRAYLFSLSGATSSLESTLSPSDTLIGGVALSADTLVAGAPVAPVGDGQGGAAYVWGVGPDCSAPGVTCCTTDAECGSAGYCDASGHCAAKKGLGQTCNPASDCKNPATCGVCTSTFCVDGVCCNASCGDACEACGGAASTGSVGTCSPAKAGTVPTCTTGALCDGTSTGCPTTCAGGCQSGYYCAAGACVPLLSPGAPCASATACASGHCIDGVCCNSACTGACQACAAALHQVAAGDGTCAPAKVGTDPHGDCPVQAPTSCGTTGECDGAGACAYFGPTTACGPTVCSNGQQVGQVCVAPGSCAPSGGPVPCFPYPCGAASCQTSCTSSADCADAKYVCVAGACVLGKAPGQACAGPTECLSGFCVDGVCCTTACGAQCESCTETGSVGTCVAVTGAPRQGRPPCSGTGAACGGTCDGSNPASCNYPGPATSCSPAACIGGTSQPEGHCDGNGSCGTGSPVACEPYACSEATGNCRTSCTNASHCASGSTCRVDGTCGPDDSPDASTCPGGKCPAKAAPADDGGCGCGTVGGEREGSGALLALFSLLLVVQRRRSGSRPVCFEN